MVKSLFNRGIVDEITHYNPNLKLSSQQNEINKRNTGLMLSFISGCTHHLSMDADEFYKDIQFKRAKRLIEENNITSSACQMQTYWKSNDIVLNPPEEYYVPFINKIDITTKFILNTNFYCLADPTRRIKIDSTTRYILFERDDIEMHHMSYVRKDIRMKLENSSASDNFKDKIDNLVKYYNEWYYPQPAKLAGAEDRYYKLKKVKPLFKL